MVAKYHKYSSDTDTQINVVKIEKMSGLKSLLNYRFQPREGEKLEVLGKTSPTSLELSPVKSEISSIPETPPSKLPSPGSPVFKSRKCVTGRKNAPVILDSSDEDDSPKKDSSPWLSKASGVKMNGQTPGVISGVKRKFEPESPTPSSSSSSSPSDNGSQDEKIRKYRQKVETLRTMFPGVAKWMLEDAVCATKDLDEAIDLIITKNRVGNGSKYRSNPKPSFGSQDSLTSTGSESTVEPPPRKRIRQISSDSSDVPDSQTESSQTLDEKGVEEKIAFLTEAFPETNRKVLQMTLVEENYSVEAATAKLTLLNKPAVSATKNVGSIKAYKAARENARNHVNLQQSSYNEDSNDDDSVDEQLEAKQKQNKNETDQEEGTKKADVPNEEDEVDTEESEDSEEEDADPITKFFSTAELQELITVPGCSKKKADTIMEIRPFTDWNDLVSKFDSYKHLNLKLITGCKELLRIRSTVNRLMQHCEQISQDMESIVSSLTDKTTLETDQQAGYITEQPATLESKFQLKPYQLVGLNWLTLMHRQELNGILADEMGLGKTIQTIAFLAQLLMDGEKGPHVIIAPSSTLDNWLRELQLWCPKLKILLYYGSQEERRDIRIQVYDRTTDKFDVVLTTYNMATGGIEDRILFKKFKFQYAIFDEGHMLKNMASLRYQNLMKIRAQRRLLLTGTPLQNNLVELMSLLCFVMPDLFVGKTDHLKRMFTTITAGTRNNGDQGSYEWDCIQRAKQIMRPFVLRRIKSEVLKQLPLKLDKTEVVPMSFEQQDLYGELRTRFSKQLNTGSELDSESKREVSGMLMQLRKAANHQLLHRRQFNDAQLRQMAPLIMKEPGHEDAREQYVIEDMQVMSDFELHHLCKKYKSLHKFQLDESQVTDTGKFRFLDALLPAIKEKGSRMLLFSQFTMMLDIIECYMKAREHKYMRLDGSTPVAERQDLIDQYNNDPDILVFLLSTRAGGLGINLTAANTVVIHDIDYNPYNDKQAEDRCHRLGQTKDVTVHRLISKNTVEEGMYRCAQGKLKLEEELTGQSSGKDDESNTNVASLLREALL